MILIKDLKIEEKNGRTIIDCSFVPSQLALGWYQNYFLKNFNEKYKELTKSKEYKKSVLFFADLIQVYKIKDDNKETSERSKIMLYSWYSNYKEIAYVHEKIFKNQNNLFMDDYLLIFQVNSIILNKLFEFISRQENMLYYSIIGLLENNEIILSDQDTYKINRTKNNKRVLNFLDEFKGTTSDNASIIRKMNFGLKRRFLLEIDVPLKEKLFFVCFDKNIDIYENFGENEFDKLMILLDNLINLRNKISHNEFLLTKKTFSTIKFISRIQQSSNDKYLISAMNSDDDGIYQIIRKELNEFEELKKKKYFPDLLNFFENL